MAGGDRIRLFCALRLPAPAADELVRWQAEHLLHGRIVPREHLHVTLAFLGARPHEDVRAVAGELAGAARQAEHLRLEVDGYRETRGVGMVVLRDLTGAATALAQDVGGRLERLGVYRGERRAWLPHVTVLRFRERPGLQPPAPALGEISPSDVAVYSSVLRPEGAQYEVLETLALR